MKFIDDSESPSPHPVALWPNEGHDRLVVEVARSHATTHYIR